MHKEIIMPNAGQNKSTNESRTQKVHKVVCIHQSNNGLSKLPTIIAFRVREHSKFHFQTKNRTNMINLSPIFYMGKP